MKDHHPINNHPSIIKLPIIIALALVCGMLIGANFFGGQARMSNISRGINKFREILSLVETSYVDSVSTDSLVEYSIKKMLEKLDPHTNYFGPDEASLAHTQLESGFDGIGIEYSIFNDTIYIANTVLRGPSDLAGIRCGDKLLAADGAPLVGSHLSSSVIFSKLRGKKGTDVKLTIIRRNENTPRQIVVTRDRIPTYSISAGYMIDQQTGYIKIDRFTESTYQEFRTTLLNLKTQGAKRLLLDLRGNPGGYKDRAEKVVDELLGEDKMIVYTDGKGSQYDSQTMTKFDGVFEKGAVMVLVDENSASAAEIVAGALQDNDRALIVGRRSFGKGLVQMPVSLADGSELRLTISRYYTPSGRSIQKPYQLGREDEYEKDYEKRIKSGELYSSDSIKFNEKLKYRTLGGRVVYGGGGITPDVFVARDTLYFTKYLSDLIGKNIIREYAFLYASQHQQELERMSFKEFLRAFAVSNDMLDDVKQLATRSQITYHEKEFFRSINYIRAQLKANIARNIWTRKNANAGLNNEYYQVMSVVDDTYQKALHHFDKAEKLAKGELVETLSHSFKH